MVLNCLFENLLPCITLTNGYYPKKFDIDDLCVQNFQKITCPIFFLIININIFHQVFCLETPQPQIYQPINRDFFFVYCQNLFFFSFLEVHS